MLAAQLLVNGLHVLLALGPQLHFLDNAGGLVHQRLLLGLDHFDLKVSPVDLTQCGRLTDGLAEHFRVFIVQRHGLVNISLGREAAHARPTRFDLLLANLQLLLGEL